MKSYFFSKHSVYAANNYYRILSMRGIIFPAYSVGWPLVGVVYFTTIKNYLQYEQGFRFLKIWRNIMSTRSLRYGIFIISIKK
jgi:hypothetical protein